jgi:predicted SAM-dependent methyltransferase
MRLGRAHLVALESLKLYRWKRERPRLVQSYLASTRPSKLHLGAGTTPLEGWLNTDLRPGRPRIVFLDVREAFPLPDRSFDYVFGEHLIEHVTLEEGFDCLRESFRVLRPGGRIRVATPSLEQLAGLFRPDKTAEQRAYIEWATDSFLPQVGAYEPGFVVNNFFSSWGHRFIYDRSTLAHVLERVGFGDVRAFAPGESDTPELGGLESHGAVIGDAANRFETLVLEARRPELK